MLIFAWGNTANGKICCLPWTIGLHFQGMFTTRPVGSLEEELTERMVKLVEKRDGEFMSKFHFTEKEFKESMREIELG